MRLMTKVALATIATAGIALVFTNPASAKTSSPPTTNVVRSVTIARDSVSAFDLIPCPACTQKNLSGGNGSGFTFAYAQFEPGKCAHLVTAVNKGKTAIDATVWPYATKVLGPHGAVDPINGQPTDRYTFIVPSEPSGNQTLYVRMTDAKGKVVIGGNAIPPGSESATFKAVLLPCPCPAAPTTTTSTTTPTPSSSVPGSSTLPPSSSSPGTTNVVSATTVRPAGPGDSLPQTGSPTKHLGQLAALLVLPGILLLLVAGRRRGAEEKV